MELDEERRQTQLNLLVHDIEVGKSDLSQTQEDLAAVKEKLTSYYEERHRLETENQELKQKRHQISEQISSDQQPWWMSHDLLVTLSVKLIFIPWRVSSVQRKRRN